MRQHVGLVVLQVRAMFRRVPLADLDLPNEPKLVVEDPVRVFCEGLKFHDEHIERKFTVYEQCRSVLIVDEDVEEEVSK